jgi:hypothetical protein
MAHVHTQGMDLLCVAHLCEVLELPRGDGGHHRRASAKHDGDGERGAVGSPAGNKFQTPKCCGSNVNLQSAKLLLLLV